MVNKSGINMDEDSKKEAEACVKIILAVEAFSGSKAVEILGMISSANVLGSHPKPDLM